MTRRGLIAASLPALALLAGACGGRADPTAANRELVERLVELPGAEQVAVEHYGYDLGGDRSEDRFFTELEYVVESAVAPETVVATVDAHLGGGWEVATHGGGDAVVATFRKGEARVAVTTWQGGFDVTVAARGAELDGTPLSL